MKTLTILISWYVFAAYSFAHAYDYSLDVKETLLAETNLFVQPQDTTGMAELVERACEIGSVRISVTLSYQRRDMFGRLRESFIRTLQDSLNVKIDGRLQSQPVIFMSVDEKALRYLYNSPYVEEIRAIRTMRVGRRHH